MKQLTDGTFIPDHDTHYQKCMDSKGWHTVFKYQKDRVDMAIQLVRAKNVAIDIGGNIGIFAKNLAAHFQRCISFEPMPKVFECLEFNTRKIYNIERHNVALSNFVNNELTMTYAETGNCGNAHANPEGNIKVPARTLDSYNFSACDLIKIDVEGHEMEVLQGAEETIKKFMPVFILEEKNYFLTGTSKIAEPNLTLEQVYKIQAPRKFLEDMGYGILGRLTHDFVMAPYVSVSP